jgi:hypothetical protein
MGRAFERSKSLLRHVGFGWAKVFNCLILSLASDQEPDLTQQEIEARLEKVLQCGF